MADNKTSLVTSIEDKFSVIFNEAVRNMIPSNVLEPSFLPRILKANKNKGISKAIL